jgi:hypothetical protein
VPDRDAAGEAGGGLGSREARDIVLRDFSGREGLIDVHTKYLKGNAYLRKELAAAR